MIMRPVLVCIAIDLLLLAAAEQAHGAVFLLANGGQIEGQLLNPDQQPRETYVVRTGAGAVVTLNKTQVDGVLEKSEALRWYEQWLPKMPQTIEGHWAMAEECRERRLKEQRQHHLEEIIKVDPNHKEARYGLGYSRVEDGWVKTDEWMKGQGYVRYGGAWRIPQDVMVEKAAEEAEKRQNDWKRKVKTWRTAIVKRRGKEQEAIDAIRAIDDPNAAPALIAILENKKENRDLRMLMIDVLGGLQSPVAVGAFIKRAIEDSDAKIRDACLDQLSRFGTQHAVRAFEKLLESKDNKIVNRAAFCLGALRQPEATLALINSLFTEHSFLVQQGGTPGQLNLGFGSGPGGGGNTFGVGGRPKLVTTELKNQSVLNALVALHPGTNFGFNIEAWKNWYVEQYAPSAATLRRDD
jgi:hypothetical protein